MLKQFITGYLSFSKKERIGLYSIVIAVAILTILPFAFPFFLKNKLTDSTAFAKEIATLKLQQPDTSRQYADYANTTNNYQPYSKKEYKIKGELFVFDPNSISIADWKRLGVRDKTIATIQNYLSKGGHFYKPDDLGKIWGFYPDEVERLVPYVQVQQTGKTAADKKAYEPTTFIKTKYAPATVDINAADTSAFIALPGIGSKLAQRITTFRDKLGGFYSIDQVGETFGLPDSVFQKIKPRLLPGNATVKQLNINIATADELKAHPYLRWNLANAIVQYRTQHGNFAAVADIKKIMLLDETSFKKVAPYLKVN